MARTWNPLGPLAWMARVITWVIGLGVLAVVIANVAGLGLLPGTAVEPACVDLAGHPARPPASIDFAQACADHPGLAQQLAGLGHQLPQALFGFGALVLLLGFLRTAAKEGPYVAGVPLRLRALGWFVLLGGPVAALLYALTQSYLRTELLTGVPAGDWLSQWDAAMPWWSLAAGVAALTFAHILRIGVRMQEDLAGTI